MLQVDVIINTPTRKLNLRSGALSSSLLKAAGRVLQEECRQNAPQGGIQYGETVMTSGGRMQCRAVVHGACCDWIDGADVCKEVYDFYLYRVNLGGIITVHIHLTNAVQRPKHPELLMWLYNCKDCYLLMPVCSLGA